MQFKRDELLTILLALNPCLSKLQLTPALRNFLCAGGVITTSDGRKALRAEFDTGLDCSVLGDVLPKLLSSSRAEAVEIAAVGDKVSVAVGEARGEIDCSPAVDFPKVPAFDPEKDHCEFNVTEELLAAVNFCFPTVSQKETQHRLTYLYVRGKDVFSGNPNHYSWAKMENEYPEFFLIQDGVDIFTTFWDKAVGRIQDGILFVSSGMLEFSARLPENLDYPNMEQTFVNSQPSCVFSVPERFLEVVHRASLFSGKAHDRTIQFGFKSATCVELVAKSEGTGQFKEEVVVAPIGEVDQEQFKKMRVNVSPDDLAIALKAADRFGVKFDAKAPVLHFADSTGNYQQIIATRGDVEYY